MAGGAIARRRTAKTAPKTMGAGTLAAGTERRENRFRY
jgi:hypothetical protein